MIRTLVAIIFCSLAGAAVAREKYDVKVLTEADTAALQGKVLAVTRHAPEDVDLHALSDAFGLIGRLTGLKTKGALRGADEDPADIFERELAPVLVAHFGLRNGDGTAPILESNKLADIVASQPQADYVLDLLTTLLRVSPNTSSARYWVGYGVRVLLIQRDTARVVFKATCYSDTTDHPQSPRLAALAENDTQLFGEVTRKLAWNCLQRVGHYFYLPEGMLPATPAELADPIAAYATAHPEH